VPLLSKPARWAAALLVLVGSADQAGAQSVGDFYKGTNLTMVVGSGAGGGYDLYTRVLARHMSKHIPGEPRIIVQNMPGADGITALNHVFAIAPRDGSVISATYNTVPLDPLFDGPASRYDPFKLSWIGSIDKQINVCVAWASKPFKTLEDAQRQEMVLSSAGATGWRTLLPRMLNNLAGTKFRVVMGYEAAASFLAVERGEVDGACTTYETLEATEPSWLVEHKITFMAQFGRTPLPELPSVPMGLERIRDADDLAAVRLVLLQQEFGRPYVAPPGLPADRLQALRDAFAGTMKDPAYLQEAKKAGMNANPMTGAEIDAVLKEAYAAPKATVERAKLILDRAAVK
jgi:tripartite-type tricarboxylate transporter receptor subunit TctC